MLFVGLLIVAVGGVLVYAGWRGYDVAALFRGQVKKA